MQYIFKILIQKNLFQCKNNHFILLQLSVLLVLTFFVITAESGTVTKDNNTTNLNLGSSWVGGIAPTSTDTAVWDNTVTIANDVYPGSDLSWHKLKVINPGGVVRIYAGNTITLSTGGIEMSSATQSLDINCGINLSTNQIWDNEASIWMEGVLSGGGNLTKNGTAPLNLVGNNTFTGSLTINNGYTYARHNNALGGTGFGTTVNSGGSLVINGSLGDISLATEPLTINGNGYGSWGALVSDLGTNTVSSDIIMGSSSAINANDGTLIINGVISGDFNLTKQGPDTLILSAANTYTGVTYVYNGMLIINNNSALGTSASGTEINSGAQLKIMPNITISEPLILNGSGIDGTGALTTASGTGESYLYGDITLASDVTIGTDLTSYLILDGVISGSSNLTYVGSKNIVVSGNNTYTGTTTLNGTDKVFLYHANGLGTTGNGTTVSDGAGLTIGNYVTTAAEPLLLYGSGPGLDGALRGISTVEYTGPVTLGLSSTISTDTITDTLTISGIISGNHSITTKGNGAIILSGNNTHSGPITVTNGSLLINGTNDFHSSITLGIGTVLGGTGSTAAVITAANNSTITPGYRSAAPLSIGGLSMTTGCSLNVDIGTVSDTLVVNGNINLNGRLNIDSVAGFGPGKYTIITYTGTLTDNTLLIGRNPGTYNYSISSDADEIFLIVSANIIKADNTTNLNLGSSWLGGIAPTNTDNAIWNSTVTSANTSSLGANVSWNKITVEDPGGLIVINSDTLTLGTGGIDMSSATQNLNIGSAISLEANQTWTVDSLQQIWTDGVISGNGDITKTGGGALFLAGNNSFTGTVNVDEGFFYPFHSNGLGSTSSGTVVNSNATLMMDGTNGDITLAAEPIYLNGEGFGTWGTISNYIGYNTLTGPISLNSSSTINVFNDKLTLNGVISGSGNLTKTGSDTLLLSGNNTFTSLTTISEGVVVLEHDTALGSTTNGTIVNSGAQLLVSDGLIDIFEPLTLNGTGINSHGALYASCDSNAYYGGEITIATDASIGTPSKSYSFDLFGNISGSGNLDIVDGAYIILSGDNSGYTGIINIGGDITIASSVNALGATTAGTVVTNGSSLGFYELTFAAEPITLNGLGYNSIGAIYVSNYSPVLTGPITLATDSRIGISGSDQTLTINGSISGNYSLDKAYIGTLKLNGNNTHNSSLSISGGAVYLNGANASQTSITLSAKTLLGGTGSTSANVIMSDSATLEPGDGSASKFRIGTLTMTNGCTLSVDIGTSNDTVAVSGDLTLDGILNINNSSGFSPGTYTIISYTGTLTDNTLEIGSNPGTYNYSISTDSNEVFLTITSTGSDIVKANNTTNLNLGSSWEGGITPTSGDNAIWNNIVSDSNTVSLGADANWGKLTIIDPGGDVTINDYTLTIGVGGIDLSSTTQNLTLNSNIVLSADQEWGVTGLNIIAATGPISGSQSIEKTGTGILRYLNNNNTYSGGTVISNGKLQIGANTEGGTLPGDVVNNSELIFYRTNDYLYSGIISGTGKVDQSGSGKLTLSGDNSYSGITTITRGTLCIAHKNALGLADSGTIVAEGAALEIIGTITSEEPLQLKGSGIDSTGSLRSLSGNNTISSEIALSSNTIIGVDTDQLTISGKIMGTDNIIKTGSGNLILSGTNSLTGTTTVSTGKLTFAGTSLTSDISVKSFATFAGVGTINSLNVDSNGIFEPGFGKVFVNSNATFSETSILNFDAGTISDTLAVGGILSLDGILNIGAAAGFGPGTYTLITYDSIINNNLSIGTKPIATYNYSIINSNNRIDLVITGSGANTAPLVVSPIKDIIAIEDNSDTIAADLNNIFSDAEEGNALAFSAKSSDTSIIKTDINTNDSSLIINFVKNANGAVFVAVSATDSNGLSVNDTFTVLVTSVNDKPEIIDTIANVLVNEDAADTLLGDLSKVFSDIEDSTNLEFGVISTNQLLVTGTINSDSLIISFKENANGSANIIISASDEYNATTYDTIAITVTSVNDVPVLESVTPWAMEANTSKTLTMSQVQASDIDGDDLFIIIESGANYTSDVSTITPNAGFTGTLTPYIKVTDGIDTSNSLPIFVTVKSSGTNHSPVLNGGTIEPIEKNSFVKVTTDMLEAYDPDGDSLTILIWDGDYYSVQGAKIIPDKGFTGIIYVPIQVTDGIIISDQINLEVSVFEKILDFYKGQVIISDTYEALIGPNPLPADANEIVFRVTSTESDRLELIIFDYLANILHKEEIINFRGKFEHVWKFGESLKFRGRSFIVIMRYYKDNKLVKTEKELIGIKK